MRELGDVRITKVAVDEKMSNNCYLLRCLSTGEQVLIDAAAEPDTLLLADRRRRAAHRRHDPPHWDHHRALRAVVDATGAEVVAGAPDADAITEQTDVAVQRRLEHGDTVRVGASTLEVIAIAGHTPGSIALLLDDDPEAGTRTCSPATRCSPAASATRSATRTPSCS